MFFSDLSVVNLPAGQPTLLMTGGSAKRLRAITPKGMAAQVHLTMTDEYPYAYAHVIISAIPEDDRVEAASDVRTCGAGRCGSAAGRVRLRSVYRGVLAVLQLLWLPVC